MLFLHFFVILVNAYLSIKKSRVSGNMKRGKFPMVGTFWAVLPPVIAIGLALNAAWPNRSDAGFGGSGWSGANAGTALCARHDLPRDAAQRHG